MNQTQSYMDVHGSHLSAASSTGGIPNYHQYHHQPPVLQPASTAYGPASSYSHYAYHNGVTSPQSASQSVTSSMSMTSQVSSQLLPLPAVTSHSVGPPGYGTDSVYDTTGQLAPPGAKPRVTATLWEDEGSLCYQIEARGVCVARREDNHMINGTKLLNVAGMTRGRRDGILKSEKVRNVVKIGPMHLKGVWIPFERALDFANKEKITDLLYPLFVHQIAELLYHPTNSNQTNMVVQDSQQRRLEAPPARTPQGPPPPLHHHHPMQSHLPPHLSQPPNNLSSQPRPVLDRANSFPTPPASASSLMGINHQGGSYDWGNQGMNSGIPNSQSLSMENTSLGTARSVPTTPATTPPGNGLQGMPPFQGQPAYDSSKPYYSAAPASNPQYAPQPISQPPMASYGQPPLSSSSYLKNDMAPPARSSGQPEAEVGDVKGDRYNQNTGQAGDTVPDHEPEYVHDNSSGYNSRGSYTYASNPSVGALSEPQLTPDMTGSPSQQNSSGRMTPRTGGGPPSQWSSGYNTPPRPAVGSLYNIVSDTRGSSTNGAQSDTYGVGSNSTSGYSTGVNGSLGIKRLREDDDVDRITRPDSRGGDYESKRRKTLTDPVGPVGGAPLALQPVKAGGVMARPR